MSTASYRNFVAANAERQRRNQLYLDDPSMPTVNTAPAWDAFYGSLHDLSDRAHASGMDLRVDQSGLGRLPTSATLENPNDAAATRSFAVNSALSGLMAQRNQDETARRIGTAQAQTAEATARGAQREQEDIGAVDQAGASATLGSENPMVQRERLLQSIPPHLRPSYEARFAAEDQKAAAAQIDADKLAEVTRHNKATEAGVSDDAQNAVAGMKEGTIPPQLPGRASKDYTKIMAEAKRQGYDLSGAVTDWNATQKHIASMNGTQQLRLNQAVNSLPDMLDSVDALASQWKGGRFPILNKANLALAKNGAYGSDAAVIANKLAAQIADVTADLGNVYMGGNSPTDHALDLASKSLGGEWDEKVLHEMVSLARQNVQIRQNSIRHTGVSGVSANNPYAPSSQASPAAAAQPSATGSHPKGSDPLGIR